MLPTKLKFLFVEMRFPNVSLFERPSYHRGPQRKCDAIQSNARVSEQLRPYWERSIFCCLFSQ